MISYKKAQKAQKRITEELEHQSIKGLFFVLFVPFCG
jgi:hypothetical protein